MNLFVLIPALLVFFYGIALLYFQVAGHYKIIDQPNHRSSHSATTIRGGGILFAIAGLLPFFVGDFRYFYFTGGLFLISLISFLDDISSLNNKIRITVHLLSSVLLLIEWRMYDMPWYILPVIIVMIIGVINAYNFMDGINGITGLYSLVGISTLLYINELSFKFAESDLMIFLCLALMVFNFFNFRKQAKCFAGDVGSVSVAFIMVFLIGLLIMQTGSYGYLLFLLVYGLDAVTTIFFRVIRGENIAQPHRSHFYQYLANEKRISHLLISCLYGGLQLLVNVLVIKYSLMSIPAILVIVLLSALLFILLRWKIEGRDVLLKTKI
ncbi:MAG: glycosyltransferase family 4 protein [Bacteroidota bacterium]